MTAIGEAVRCRCGERMMLTHGRAVGYACPNCDDVQPQEKVLQRMKTISDVRYDNHWERIFNTQYPPMPDGWEKQAPGVEWPPPTTEETPS